MQRGIPTPEILQRGNPLQMFFFFFDMQMIDGLKTCDFFLSAQNTGAITSTKSESNQNFFYCIARSMVFETIQMLKLWHYIPLILKGLI